MQRFLLTLLGIIPAHAAEFHVSGTKGNDAASGSADKPFKTIMAAAHKAVPGDTITVHAGVYRERIDPPRGGTDDAHRIIYQTAKGEKVVVTGAEPVTGWVREKGDTWKAVLPESFFTDGINPFTDVITGDWFHGNGRVAHTGEVYLNGHWLTEAGNLNQVLNAPAGAALWFAQADRAASGESLINLDAFTIGDRRVEAENHNGAAGGPRPAPITGGGQCLGWISDGSTLTYRVNFGTKTDTLTFRAAAYHDGGKIEIRLGDAKGELLGTANITKTGDWQKWEDFTAKIKPTGGEQSVTFVFRGRNAKPASDKPANTVVYASFPGKDPNKELVEVNVRQTVFYPSKNFINHITVRGFTLQQAAPNYAPPTVEQKAIIGPNWAKGW
ncbi:MAG TPA: carbohydrate-binding protein, partial [Luteolibacter sp.]